MAAKKRTAKAPGPKAVKATHHLSVEASRRIGVEATMTGKSRSEVVEVLVMTGLRRFVVQDRGGAGPALHAPLPCPAEPEAEATESAA
jgi:hypothetical protein